MVLDDHVKLERHFVRVPLKKEPVNPRFGDRSVADKDTIVTWQRLISFRRCVILAEPGAGKTQELRLTTRQCRSDGKAAFFIRIEYLLDGIERAFEDGEHGSYDEFQAWISANEKGWFFLDSVDESKLTSPRNFERALREFSRHLGVARQRANIFLTSRPSEWRSPQDLALVNSYFPLDVGGQARDAAIVYSLAGLDLAQINLFLQARHVKSREEFTSELAKHAAAEFASRPRDLEDLIAFWVRFGRLGTPLELIEHSVATKLTEPDTARDFHRPLAKSRALDGARTLAGAVTFQKDQRIRIPESEAEGGVEADMILSSWPRLECLTLLDKPIFDDATYGTVRFHHRTVREFLTAQWLDGFLKAGKGRRRIERLLFDTAGGRLVIRPIGKQILPWLSHLDDRIRDRVLATDPELLIEQGDATKFNLDIREAILRNVIEQGDADHTGRVEISQAAIERFASLDIEPTVKALFRDVSLSERAQLFLLKLVEHGKFQQCKEQALRIARDRLTSQSLRVGALNALSAVIDPTNAYRLIDEIMAEKELLSNGEVTWCLLTCFPDKLPTGKLAALLAEVRYPSGLVQRALTSGIKSYVSKCSLPERERLFEALVGLKLRSAGASGLFKEDFAYHWLQQPLENLLHYLVVDRSARALCNDSLHILNRCNYISPIASASSGLTLSEAVSGWAELNYQLFWYSVQHARCSRSGRSVGELVWASFDHSSLWSFTRRDIIIFQHLSERLLDETEREICSMTASYLADPPIWRRSISRHIDSVDTSLANVSGAATPNASDLIETLRPNPIALPNSYLSEQALIIQSGERLYEDIATRIRQMLVPPAREELLSALGDTRAGSRAVPLSLLLYSDPATAIIWIKANPPIIGDPGFADYAQMLQVLFIGRLGSKIADLISAKNGPEWARALYDQFLPTFVAYYHAKSTYDDQSLVDFAATLHGLLLSIDENPENPPASRPDQAATDRLQGLDLPIWTTKDFIEFSRRCSTRPNSLESLHETVSLDLADLKDELELTDDALAPLLRNAGNEMQLRNYVAKWLRDTSGGNYSVTQEEELSTRRRRDITIHGRDFDGRVTIEMKIADAYSGAALFTKLKTQLIDGYLRDPRANRGIYLLLRRKAHVRWRNANCLNDVDFEELIEQLQGAADALAGGSTARVQVIGVDLCMRPSDFGPDPL
ncbi:NACHT domain-containing NTPase [Rhizobium rhizogenes]|uniref:NACHT domain-containing protein n=1 Tax=Rhizobium rhizogenes TaxID=359 RepID=UPI0015730E42|nr:hypothetical protein [Rhizobium rhizogenes]NTF46616.1 hypothetical protein [Rhizobium rhizogenes]